MLAILLSILFPGLGQIYYGKNTRGIIMLLLGLTPLYPIALVWSIIDIIRLNKQGLTPKFDKKEAIWALVLLFVLIPVCVFILIYGSWFLFGKYSTNYMLPKETQQEGIKIVTAINKYKAQTGKYPDSIDTIIKGRPIRSGWSIDSWGEQYVYKVTNDGQSFLLISKGKDRTIDTDDDIIFKE